MPTTALRFALRLCGSPAFGSADGPLHPITLQRGAALLACLARTRGPLPRGRLFALLSPEAGGAAPHAHACAG